MDKEAFRDYILGRKYLVSGDSFALLVLCQGRLSDHKGFPSMKA